MTDLDKLIGKVITEITVSEDKLFIKFETTSGVYQYRADGDCCSNSWIESIEDKEVLYGNIVTKIVDHEIGQGDGSNDYTDIKVYTYDICCDKGTCTLDFRNESNGYYGGSLSLLGHYDE